MSGWLSNAGSAQVYEVAPAAYLSQFNRLAASDAMPYVNLTADGVIAGTPCIIGGYVVTVALSAAVINVYDNATTNSGTILFVIPASQAVGQYPLAKPIITTNGAYADFLGTGTVNFLAVPTA
ncbi:MAG: hypothetical protein ACREIB_11475 [Pseudomonadota bacterium]